MYIIYLYFKFSTFIFLIINFLFQKLRFNQTMPSRQMIHSHKQKENELLGRMNLFFFSHTKLESKIHLKKRERLKHSYIKILYIANNRIVCFHKDIEHVIIVVLHQGNCKQIWNYVHFLCDIVIRVQLFSSLMFFFVSFFFKYRNTFRPTNIVNY